jgi:sugar O-acyltransferase (sialic acid O-acetyltransferase NeuD family)
MKNNKIIIIGSGGHATSCINIIENIKQYKIHGIVDNKKNIKNLNYNLIGNDKDLLKIKKKVKYAFIGIGQIKSPEKRKIVFDNLKKKNFTLPKIISAHSLVSKHSQIGEGTIIMNFAHINMNVKIGKNCIINTGSNLEHDVEVGDFVHISTGAIINGNTKIGSNTFIGSGAIVNNNLKIGNNCIIASGKVVKKNLKSGTIYK